MHACALATALAALPQVSSRLAEDSIAVANGIGEKLCSTWHYVVTFLAGLIIGFVKSWQMTLIVLAITPFLAVVMAYLKVRRREARGREGRHTLALLT